MWLALSFLSAFCLGFYDIFKKISLKSNNVLLVLFLNTVFGTLLMSPVIIGQISQGSLGLGGLDGHLQVMLKAAIVLSSWICGYFAIKHLPLTIQGPINASRPVLVLVGALAIFGERLNALQWAGILLGFASLFFISRLGAKEGFSFRHSKWLYLAILATLLGAVSALYDKYLMRFHAPAEVQAWYSLYQCILMGAIICLLLPRHPSGDKFRWKWSIPCISLFLTTADLAYFYALSYPDSMIAIVSMVRRGSVIISFLYGVLILHEKNIKAKAVDLGVLIVSLLLLVLGANS
ncbi:MAG: DMT family transporter [Clostridium sp.]|nr:DMT family transporter [Clostridium sp.]